MLRLFSRRDFFCTVPPISSRRAFSSAAPHISLCRAPLLFPCCFACFFLSSLFRCCSAHSFAQSPFSPCCSAHFFAPSLLSALLRLFFCVEPNSSVFLFSRGVEPSYTPSCTETLSRHAHLDCFTSDLTAPPAFVTQVLFASTLSSTIVSSRTFSRFDPPTRIDSSA